MKIKLLLKNKNCLSLLIKPSKTIRLLLMVLFLSFFNANATTYYTNVNGSPSSTLSWWTGTVGTGTNPANFTTAGDVFTIQSGDNMTMTANWAVTGTIVINSGGTLTMAGANNLTAGTITVNGNIDYSAGASGTFPATGITFNSGSQYNLKTTTTAGLIPQGVTWNVGSTCLISGYTSYNGGSPNNLNMFNGQTFYNFTWNCPFQSVAIGFGPVNYTTTINGNFTIVSTGSGTLHARITGASSTPTININGDLIIQGGNFDLQNDGGSGNQTATINLAGNYNQTGGTVLSSTTQTGSLAIINFTGLNKTFTQSGGTFNNGTGTSNINININNGASLTLNNSIATLSGYGVTVNSGGTLNVGTNLVTGAGTFALSAGGTLITANTVGITASGATGSIQTTTRTFNAGANYTYNGSSAQVVGSGLPATVSNLTISNTAGVTLARATAVTNNFSITTGAIANLGAFTHTAGTLTLGGGGVNSGSWGSTISTATHKDDTYFAAAGIVTVTTDPPTTTGVSICVGGGSGTLAATGTCGSSNSKTAVANPTNGNNVTGIGTVAWINPGNITVNNGSYATYQLTSNATKTTNYLQGTGFGFAIPLNATINGIQVSVNRYSNNNNVQDNEVRLIKAGTIVGSNNAVTGNWSTSSSTVVNYGGVSDLWGTTWTPTDINDANFGASLVANIKRNGSNTTASVDNMNITITYVIAGVEWYTLSSGGTAIGYGTSFDPVAAGAMANTNTAGTTTYYAACSLNPGCRAPTDFIINAIPTVGTITQPDCVTATGSVVLSGLPATGTWTLSQSDGASSVTTTGTGISTTISGLSPGTYTYSSVISNNVTGLKGEYFNNMTLSGTPALTQTDATVNFDWVNGSPDPSIPNDLFSVRWSGQIQPIYSETYTFTTSSDDGIRLWVNGTKIIDNWTDHAITTNTGTITLTAGIKYNIVLEYYENAGQAVSKLSWSSPSQVLEIIPQSQLYSVASCGSPASANVVINAQPSTPATPATTVTQPTCALATGTITVTSPVPAAGIAFTVTGTSPIVAAVTNTTGVFSGLAVGSYNFTVTNSSGCISGATSVTISPLLTNIWTTSWSLGTPTVDQDLDFQGNYNLGADVEGCSCKVNSGAAVVFKTGSTLKITNEVKVLSGTLTFENNASLVQINDAAVNKGDITYMRKTNSVRSSDYTYWSSPVASQLLKDVSPSYTSGMFYSFNATIGNWVSEATSNIMEVGKGYIIRGPQSNLPQAPYDASFIGIPNNGPPVSPISIGAAGTSNLIGNPYPSALDADAFLNANSNVLEGTLYFWTHNTAIQLSNTGTAYVYTSNDYASYNGVGGVAALQALSIATGGLNTTKPSGKIAAGQSFFSTSKVAGTATFNNSMRVGVGGITGDNAQFFKINTTKAKSASAIEKHRVWLNLTNSQGAFKQTLVGYVTGATNGYDGRFDGESFNGNQFVDFYSVNQNKNLTIQGRALPFEVTDTVPLGYRTTIEGTFTINIDQADGLLAGQAVFIEDKLNNTVFDLKSGDYTFTTVKGTFNDRFVLRYTNKTLGTKDFIVQENQVLVSNINKQIKINSDVETIDKVQVYDLSGKQIYQKTNVNSNELSIPNLVSSHQVLVVKTILQNGQTVTKKIIY